MPRVSELVADRAETRVPLDLGFITIAYRPRLVTTAWQQKVAAAEEAGEEQAVVLFSPIRDALIEWDLEQDDGTPYPFTDEALSTLPRQILTNILLAVVASARPNQSRLAASFTDGSSAPSTPPTPMRTPSRRTGSG